jgi:hypothetical protein
MAVRGEAAVASPCDVQVSFEKSSPMSMVGFPLLLIPLAIYNIIVFLMPGVSLAEPLVTLPLTSGAQWPVTLSDVLVALGIVMLLFEVIKGARPGAKFLTDHLLSLIVLGGAVTEFLLWPRFATSAFFLLTLLALTDFLTGVSLRVRRGVTATGDSGRAARRAQAEVRREPVDAHAGAWHPASESPTPAPSAPAPSSFAHSENPPLSEPRPGPTETATVTPAASEAPLAGSHSESGSQPSADTTQR